MGKECGPGFSSRLWGGALRDETNNGCVGDYRLIAVANFRFVNGRCQFLTPEAILSIFYVKVLFGLWSESCI